MKPDSQMTLDRYFRQCVGIDVSKDKFTACLQMYDRASDVGCHTMSIDFDNTKSGFNQFVKWSRKEAVKGFPLAYHLHKIGQTVYVVLPNKARSFCEAEGIKTKTDAMDARSLALMGCTSRKLKPWSPPAPIYRELRQMTRFHADLSQIMTSVMNRMESLSHMEKADKTVRKNCQKLIDEIGTLMENNGKAIMQKVAEDKELEARVKRIAKAKGLGVATVVCIVAETISKRGNAHIRAALYMPALVAVRYNPQIKAAYGRICQKHPKEKKIGVAAAMRRLLLLIYTLWKNGEEYDPMRDKTHTHQKKMKEEDTELEYEPEDCIGPKRDPADWNATDEHGNPPF